MRHRRGARGVAKLSHAADSLDAEGSEMTTTQDATQSSHTVILPFAPSDRHRTREEEEAIQRAVQASEQAKRGALGRGA